MIAGQHHDVLDALPAQHRNGVAPRIAGLIGHADDPQRLVVRRDQHGSLAVGREPIETFVHLGGAEPMVLEEAMVPDQRRAAIHLPFGAQSRQ